MANNTRSKIRNKLNQADDHFVKALACLDFIFEAYDESNLTSDVIIDTVFNCMMLAQQFENIPPIEVYRALLREGKVEYLGRYDQHLFNLASIYISAKSINSALTEFKLWETKL